MADTEAPPHYPGLTTTDDGVVLSSDADAKLLGELFPRFHSLPGHVPTR